MSEQHDNDAGELPSKSQRKRESHALQALGARLVELPPDQVAGLALPDNLHAAVQEARRIRQHGARKRQLQYIGKLMRQIDATPIEDALEALEQHSAQATAQLHRVEQWRDRLLAEGDDALQALFDDYPAADRQHLRQLVRTAIAERRAEKPPRGARALFRALRELLQGDS